MNRRQAERRGRLAERQGRWAEALCRLLLRLKGYRILAQRCRTPAGEIDIVAVRGRLLIIVEVKARAQEVAAQTATTTRQWRRLARAAELFVAARPSLHGHAVRFDLMTVAASVWPRHYPDVWRTDVR